MPKTNNRILVIIFFVALIGITIVVMSGKSSQNATVTPTPTVISQPTVSPTEVVKPTVITVSPSPTVKKISVNLQAQNGFPEKGTATLEEKNGKVVVTINVSNPTASAMTQPAHIHMGSCPNPGSIVYPLTNVSGGSSVTTLNTTFAKLKSQMPLSINIHQSAQNIKVYISCGNVVIK